MVTCMLGTQSVSTKSHGAFCLLGSRYVSCMSRYRYEKTHDSMGEQTHNSVGLRICSFGVGTRAGLGL